MRELIPPSEWACLEPYSGKGKPCSHPNERIRISFECGLIQSKGESDAEWLTGELWRNTYCPVCLRKNLEEVVERAVGEDAKPAKCFLEDTP